ncbi:hypothetical protein MYSTI_01961 [Myxococcus stipitatus DSM 14675]|uniref:Uncharacterized protein n=1 Tax=Myxococcus stipitatus (strain DSM 14675 / JCM 12634 / Mx s8) TaxID=1278073 RepID=L7U606_MYXSD|nr:hypothetical protein MYSTI_01961 [Myxococcus stipitatus DSM 14675]
MSRRMSRAARRFLIATVARRVCETCRSAPGEMRGWRVECGPCQCKRVDGERRFSTALCKES